MKKLKSPKAVGTSIKWPTKGAVEQRKLEHRAKGAITAEKARVNRIRKMIQADAATRLPMPTTTSLSKEIAEAYGSEKLVAGSPEAKEHKDEYDKNNKAWDEVNNIYDLLLGLIAIPSLLAPFARGEVIASIPRAEQLVFGRICRALMEDGMSLVQLAKDVSAGHEGKIGRAPDMEEQSNARYVFSQYVDVFELWTMSTLPLIDHFCILVQGGLSGLELTNPELARAITTRVHALLDEMGKAMKSAASIVNGVTGDTIA